MPRSKAVHKPCGDLQLCAHHWQWNQLEMLLIPNTLCWSFRKCNCACALPAEVQLRLRVTRRSWQKLFAGKNFVKILVTAQTQLPSYSEQQRAFGNSNICNCQGTLISWKDYVNLKFISLPTLATKILTKFCDIIIYVVCQLAFRMSSTSTGWLNLSTLHVDRKIHLGLGSDDGCSYSYHFRGILPTDHCFDLGTVISV